MSKKKKTQLSSASRLTDNQNEIDQNELDQDEFSRAEGTTAILDQPAPPPVQRPALTERAPVTPDGRIIKDVKSRDDGQMGLRSAAGEGDVPANTDGEVQGKTWGDPYKAIFTCPEMGFELGENRRFNQRVFHFLDKPTEEILAELKESKFIYRGAEKVWTIPANAQTRKLTDELARKWAGPGNTAGIER